MIFTNNWNRNEHTDKKKEEGQQFVSYTKYLKDCKNKQFLSIQAIKQIKKQQNNSNSKANNKFNYNCCRQDYPCDHQIGKNKHKILFNNSNYIRDHPLMKSHKISNIEQEGELNQNNQGQSQQNPNTKQKSENDQGNTKINQMYKRRDNIESLYMKNNIKNIERIDQLQLYQYKYSKKQANQQIGIMNQVQKQNQLKKGKDDKSKTKTMMDEGGKSKTQYLNINEKRMKEKQQSYINNKARQRLINQANNNNEQLEQIHLKNVFQKQKQKNVEKQIKHKIDQKACIVNGKLVYIQQVKPQLDNVDQLINSLNQNNIRIKDYIYGNKEQIIQYIQQSYKRKKDQEVSSYIDKNMKKQEIIKLNPSEWYHEAKSTLFDQE